MLRNYFLTALRNLRKNITYSAINIFGLSVGLATCLLILTWITHELSYDHFHEKSSSIYRASLEMQYNGQKISTAVSPTALLPALKEFPEVEEGVRVYNPSAWNPFVVKKDDNLFHETRFYVADSTFFKVFSFSLIEGNEDNALRDPYSVILTASTAKKYFGNADPVGKTLLVNNTQEYTVTGVLPDVPSNSLLQFDLLASFASIRQGREQPTWWSANYQTFFVVRDGTDIASLDDKIDTYVNKAIGASNPQDQVRYNLIKLTDIHLRSSFENEPEVVGSIDYIYIFGAVALLILAIACINYVNLATARAMDRAKEVGIRKVAGAFRNQLLMQFIGESALITIVAYLVAFSFVYLTLPIFNALTSLPFDTSVFFTPSFILTSVVAILMISLCAGAYPALAITSFKPVSVLKGNFKHSGNGVLLRKALVVTQFSISVVLIVCTLVIYKQLAYIQNKKTGFQKENVLVMPLDKQSKETFDRLKTEFVRKANVVAMGRATESPIRIQGGYSFDVPGQNIEEEMLLTAVACDTGYIPALNINIIEGRNFNGGDFARIASDTVYSFIVNQSVLEALYLSPKDAIGKRASLSGRQGEIVGVVEDFHFSSLHNPIGPLVIFSEETYYNLMFVRLPTGNIEKELAEMKTISASVAPHRPFEYEFLDTKYNAMYASEQKLGTLFTVFATLAIIIACSGLLGLVAFSAAQKTKEIGIRKVLGATPSNIVMLITRDFTTLVAVAICIGIPVSLLLMTRWLSGFAYHAPIGSLPFIIASVTCLVIAFGTAGAQALRAALIDPSKTLRNE
jgi:putative ABC transport system permease protein